MTAFSSHAFKNLTLQSICFIHLFTSDRNNSRNFIPKYSNKGLRVEIIFSKFYSTSDTEIKNMTAKIIPKY